MIANIERKPPLNTLRGECKKLVANIWKGCEEEEFGILIKHTMTRILNQHRMWLLLFFSRVSIGKFIVLVLSNPAIFQRYMEEDLIDFLFNDTGVILQLKGEYNISL